MMKFIEIEFHEEWWDETKGEIKGADHTKIIPVDSIVGIDDITQSGYAKVTTKTAEYSTTEPYLDFVNRIDAAYGVFRK